MAGTGTAFQVDGREMRDLPSVSARAEDYPRSCTRGVRVVQPFG
jgi:hypothetical protein